MPTPATNALSSTSSTQQDSNDAIRRGFQAISDIEEKADGSCSGDDPIMNGRSYFKVELAALPEKESSERQRDAASSTVANCDGGELKIRWIKTLELEYMRDQDGSSDGKVDCITCCFHCHTAEAVVISNGLKLLKCPKCNVASYCSRDCQVADWKGRANDDGFHKSMPHKKCCNAYKRLSAPSYDKFKTILDMEIVRESIISKIRFYVSPYAIHNMITIGLGKGFLFVQSNSTLVDLSLPQFIDLRTGRRPSCTVQQQPRSVLIHFLTLGEYDQELCRDDFEMTLLRQDIVKIMEEYDPQIQIVYVMKFRCGHVALGCVPLVPDYRLCLSLGKEYFGHDEENGTDALQLNLDDM